MSASYILAARRSPIVPRNGAFAELALHDLAAPVILAALQDAGIAPRKVDELILSNALGAGGNPARSAALATGLRPEVAGLSVDRQCVGGLDALILADAMIRSGLHEIVVAGGAESYSRRPLRYRTFADGRPPQPYDQAPFTPWPERDPDMAEAADRLAGLHGISRDAQDAWAMRSHSDARAAQPPGIAPPGVVPIHGQTQDPFPRTLSPRLCAKAPVVHGSVTAANMAVAADGAAFAIVVSERIAQAYGGGAQIVGRATLGGDPALPGLAPVAAIKAALAQADCQADALQTAEIMEAFAVQALLCQRQSGIDRAILNPYGGGLARGHPIGASGAVLAVNLFHRLQKTPGLGLAAIAAAGGLGTALLLRTDAP
ncbi:thiolase family protein [Thalassobius sp. S69A]|uniref:thiolase family protein n=1 Tax=unclassified Thalassovita TaxID=2619711 RepID=UPI000C61009D|nr:acetyl-CoA C-acyltransferase [Paracoccaceae bacterium]